MKKQRSLLIASSQVLKWPVPPWSVPLVLQAKADFHETHFQDIVAFTVTSGRRRLNLDCLPRIPGLPPVESRTGDTGSNFHLTSSQFEMTYFRPVSNRVVESASGSEMNAIDIGNLDLLFSRTGRSILCA